MKTLCKAALCLFAAALLLSCTKTPSDPQPEPLVESEFIGTVNVDFNGETYPNENITVVFSPSEDGTTATLGILQIRFVPQMPVTVDAYIRDVVLTRTEDGATFGQAAEIPTTDPEGLVPMERYPVSGFQGTIKGDKLSFSLHFGAFPTSFEGSRK